MVSSVQDVDHPFCIAVAKIGRMGRPVVHHGLVDGVGRFVGKYARGQTGDNFLNIVGVTQAQDVIIDCMVLAEKVQVCPHVVVESSNLSASCCELFFVPPGSASKGIRTMAARWIMCVGRYFWKRRSVSWGSFRLQSLEERKIHSSSGRRANSSPRTRQVRPHLNTCQDFNSKRLVYLNYPMQAVSLFRPIQTRQSPG